MQMRRFHLTVKITLTAIMFLAACAPKPEPAPAVDTVGTMAAELASAMLTQTAAAASPTPEPPTITPTPATTDTPTPEPTPEATSIPVVVGNSPCYMGPGNNYPLVSNITDTKEVTLIGISNVPGWYVIENPYFGSQCWISAEHLKIESDFDVTAYPTVTR